MIYLGSTRVITNTFTNHKTAEDYAGAHQSDIKINGTGRVIKVISGFKSHEDSINYNDFINNQTAWKDGNYYNCVSITGKKVRLHYSEVGGNQIWIETYSGNDKITLRLAHLDSVLVKVGDVVNSNTIIAKQGNTGLVLSNKSKSDVSYGSHVHLEVINQNGTYLNPRKYATGEITTSYLEQSNTLDKTKRQIQIMVDKINIRSEASETSTDLGDVYNGEVYNILEEVDSQVYIWYKITTNRGLTGFVASKKGESWMKVLEINSDNTPPITIVDEEVKEPEIEESKKIDGEVDQKLKLIFTCDKKDYYYIKMYPGEKLYLEK